MKTAFILFFLILLYSVTAKAQQSFNSLNVKDLNVNGNIQVVSTTQASTPCPEMTEAQRDAIPSPVLGNCVTNSDTLALNVYNGTIWKAAGGGGVNQWITSTGYNVDDVVIESFKFYVCLIAHTSGTFATDLAGLNWQEVSPGLTGVITMANGGTDKALTSSLGGVVYTDANSMEVLGAGTSGQALQSNGAAAPTWVNKSISGKAQNLTAVTVEELQAPGSLLTETATGKYLHETGNLNLLANPSFEHSITASGWSSSVTSTATATYGTGSTTTKELGSKQGTFSCAGGASGGACLFYQDVTTSKVLQGLVLAYVSTTNAPATQVYSRVNGSNNKSTTLQQTSEQLYKVPELIGGTSTGIAVLVTVPASTTYTGTIDGAFVGAVDLKQDINNIGAWVSYTPTLTGFGTATGISFQYRQVGQNIEIRGKFTSGTSTAVEARASLPGSFTSADSSVIPSVQVIGKGAFSVVSAADGVVLADSSVSYLNFAIQNASLVGTTKITGSGFMSSGQTFSFFASVPVAQLSGASSVYTAQNADTDWASCGHTTSDFTGFGTVTAIETQCKRDGGDLLMKGKFTSGTSTAVEARLALKFNSTALTSKGVSSIPTIQLSGDMNGTNFAGTLFRWQTLIEPSTAYITFGIQNSTQAGLTKALGTVVDSSGSLKTFSLANVRIPINGWENSNVIIGTFNEVVTSPGISKPKTCHYAFGGASATLAAPTVCSTGTCIEVYDSCNAGTPPTFSSAGYYLNATFANGTWANSSYIDCRCKSFSATVGAASDCDLISETGDQTWATTALGGFVAGSTFSTNQTGVAANAYVQIICTGQAP